MISSSAAEAFRRQRPWLTAILIIYAIVQFLYITATPLQVITLPDSFPAYSNGEPRSVLTGIGPDEKEYLVYILSLTEQGKLPAPSPGRKHSSNDYVSYQAQHPPLFFALAAIVYRVTEPLGPAAFWYIIRGLCALCGAVVIVLSARAAAVAFPQRPLIYLAAAPFVAFTPMFGHMTGNVSNEPLAMAFAAAVWLQIVRVIRSGHAPTTRNSLLLGALLGLACLTRLTALMWLPAAATALIWSARRVKVSPVTPLALFGIVLALLVAPWFIRNQIAYGASLLRTFDRPLLAYGTFSDFIGAGIHPPNAPLMVTPLATALWYASTAWWPYWLLQFYLPGFPQAGPAWQSLFLIADVAVALLLFLNGSRSRREGIKNDDEGGRILLRAAGATLLFCVIALLEQQFFSDWNVVNSPGRYLVAAIPATSLLFLFALSTIDRLRTDAKSQQTAAVIVAVVMLTFDLTAALMVRRFYVDHPAQSAVQPIQEARLLHSVRHDTP